MNNLSLLRKRRLAERRDIHYLFDMISVRRAIVSITCIIPLILSCQSEKTQGTGISPTRITSLSEASATGGVYFCYRVGFQAQNPQAATIQCDSLPYWLTANADSVYGVPPDVFSNTRFRVIVQEGRSADTLVVVVRVAPCIVVYGDSRSNHTVHRKIVALIMASKPKAVFHTGDLVENGFSASQWDSFNIITSNLRSASEFYPALGNHENQPPLFFSNFELPNNEQWYSVERNRIHFVVLNSNAATAAGSEQFAWLESDLAQIADSIKFIVAILHHPPYSTGPHVEDEKGLRETFVPLFERYGVDVVFTGHDHCYERSYCGGRYYIVTGGGGAPLYGQARQHPCSQLFLTKYHFCKLSIINDRLNVRVIDANLQLIDQFEVAR